MIASGETEYPSELIRWEPEAERLARAGESRRNIVYQVRYPHRPVPLFLEHATDPAILDPLEDFLGPDIVIYNTQALLKPAYNGTSQPWHQDSVYWPIRACNLVTPAGLPWMKPPLKMDACSSFQQVIVPGCWSIRRGGRYPQRPEGQRCPFGERASER